MTQTKVSRKPTKYGTFQIHETKPAKIVQFTNFAVDVYNQTSAKNKVWKPIEANVIQTMLLEDKLHYPYAHFFELTNEKGELIGTTKITLKNKDLQFPFENYFGVNLTEQLQNLNLTSHEIWHFGRLAVKPGQQSLKALNTLLYHSLSIVSRHTENVLIAECDVDFCRKLEFIGIRTYKVGLPQNYVGSPTFPIIATAADLQNYLKTVKL